MRDRTHLIEVGAQCRLAISSQNDRYPLPHDSQHEEPQPANYLMEIIPVIDLKDGWVVRGIAGKRSSYRPIKSSLVSDASPPAVAQCFVDHFGLRTHYVADLNSIAGERTAWSQYEEISAVGVDLWVDFGCSNAAELHEFHRRATSAKRRWRPIVGLETIPSPEAFKDLADDAATREQTIFSLDLDHGRPVNDSAEWFDWAPERIADLAIELGIRTIIVLDLSAVGMYSGPSTLDLIRSLVRRSPDVAWIAGGGIRDEQDLRAFRDAGCHGTLVASALHDGGLSMASLEALRK